FALVPRSTCTHLTRSCFASIAEWYPYSGRSGAPAGSFAAAICASTAASSFPALARASPSMIATFAAAACFRPSSSARFAAPVGAVDGGEHGLERVVILLRDRVELVVVALGAVDGQAHERADRVRHEVVAVEVPGHLPVDLRLGQLGVADEVPRPGGEEAQG